MRFPEVPYAFETPSLLFLPIWFQKTKSPMRYLS